MLSGKISIRTTIILWNYFQVCSGLKIFFQVLVKWSSNFWEVSLSDQLIFRECRSSDGFWNVENLVINLKIKVSIILTYFVEIERKLARDRTIQPGLQVSRPILRQNILATGVPFANSRHTGIHTFAAIYVFHCRLAEEKEHVTADIVRSHEIWFWNKFKRRWWLIQEIIEIFIITPAIRETANSCLLDSRKLLKGKKLPVWVELSENFKIREITGAMRGTIKRTFGRTSNYLGEETSFILGGSKTAFPPHIWLRKNCPSFSCHFYDFSRYKR